MEIKYTLEILTKDIQDIGKLVENLQNSPDGSTLELDLALSKLRNVYDILTVIRTDISIPGQLSRQAPVAAAPPPPVVETPRPEPKVAAKIPEPVAEIIKPEPVAETPEAAPVTETFKSQPAPEPVAQTPSPEAEPAVQPPESFSGKDPSTIAEKFASESSINENLAGNREADMDSKLMGQPIDHIGRNIGINDRFLIIRELFDGDSDGFGKLIQDLDKAGTLQSANDRLQSQFSNTPDHSGVSILDKLVRRKYSNS